MKLPFSEMIFCVPLNLWLFVYVGVQVNVSGWPGGGEATENWELFSDDVRQHGWFWLHASSVGQQCGTFHSHDARASQTEEGTRLMWCHPHSRRFLLCYCCLHHSWMGCHIRNPTVIYKSHFSKRLRFSWACLSCVCWIEYHHNVIIVAMLFAFLLRQQSDWQQR